MNDDASKRHEDKASPDTPPQWQSGDSDDSEPNFVALGLGFLVVLGLLVSGWFIVSQMHCNPLYSDAGLSHSRACR